MNAEAKFGRSLTMTLINDEEATREIVNLSH